MGAVLLAKRAQSYLIRGWGESWGRDVGSAEKVERDVLVKEVIRTITPGSVVSAFRSIEMIRTRMESGIRAKGRDASLWVDGLDDMVEAVEAHTRDLLIGRFAEVSDGGELWDLVSGKGFADDLLERLVKEIVDGIATTHGCVEGPRLYQVRE